MENKKNIRYVCNDCAKKFKQDTQSNLDKILEEVNADGTLFFKIKKEDNGKAEHFWVKVITLDIEEKEFSGTIDNDLVVLKNFKNKQLLSHIKFSEIESVYYNNKIM